jgi:uncharacterized membrane protein
VGIFNFFNKKQKHLISQADEETIVKAIREAEVNTSGEVRVYMESKCRFVDPLDRAKEVFYSLKMENTVNKNAVIIYVALKHKQLAIYGDAGIAEKVGKDYWNQKVKQLLVGFKNGFNVAQLCETILQIGQALKLEFPYSATQDKNELPDNIVFGN